MDCQYYGLDHAAIGRISLIDDDDLFIEKSAQKLDRNFLAESSSSRSLLSCPPGEDACNLCLFLAHVGLRQYRYLKFIDGGM